MLESRGVKHRVFARCIVTVSQGVGYNLERKKIYAHTRTRYTYPIGVKKRAMINYLLIYTSINAKGFISSFEKFILKHRWFFGRVYSLRFKIDQNIF